jgi:peptide deformylase
MTEETILKYPNKMLTTPCEAFDFANPPGNPNELAIGLMQVMNQYNGVGLAANQVGIPLRVFVMKGAPENFVCFNPKIVVASEEQELLEEGCLSFPGVNVKVKRPKSIKARFQTPSGETTTMTFTGLTARVFQHELDHLDGIVFFNRANRYHRDKALRGYYNDRK